MVLILWKQAGGKYNSPHQLNNFIVFKIFVKTVQFANLLSRDCDGCDVPIFAFSTVEWAEELADLR